MGVHAAPATPTTVVVAVDVGKTEFAASVTDAARRCLLRPQLRCPMAGPSLAGAVDRIVRLLPAQARVKVAIEEAGHYHRPLLSTEDWPAG